MASVAAAIQRLSKEKKKLDASRVCDFYAAPLDDNIFEWHFTLRGPPETPYAEGLYHGALRFPRSYPFAPPDVVFFTPSGRFEVGVNICSSISSYHPEKWQPTYDIELVLVALRLFMAQEEERGIGSLLQKYADRGEKERLARDSHRVSCAMCGMRSAREVWETQMEPFPPVSPEVAASVPEMHNTTAPGRRECAGDKEKCREDEEEKRDAAVANCGGGENDHGEERSAPRAVGAAGEEGEIAAANRMGSVAEMETTRHAATVETDFSSGQQQQAGLEKEEDEAKEGAPPSESASPSPLYIRIRLMNRCVLRVDVKHIDRAIAACTSVCVAILLKKCFWA